MTTSQAKAVEKIRADYTEREKELTEYDELISLDKKVKLPAEIFAYSFGTVGSLILGTGMSIALEVLALSLPIGIAIGVAGLAMVSANYFIYKAILKARKSKYAKQICELSNNLLNQ